MKIEISIDISEDKITELVEREIVRQVVEAYSVDNIVYDSTVKRGVRDGMNEVVKNMLYAHKEDIIEAVIDRASVEMVRKGMPKLIEKMTSKE